MSRVILWPQRLVASDEHLIRWAQDDVVNGATGVFTDPTDVRTVEDALLVLNDSGSVTIGAD